MSTRHQWSFFSYSWYLILVLLKHTTWRLLYVKIYYLNLIGWSWWHLYLCCHSFVPYPVHKFRRISSLLMAVAYFCPYVVPSLIPGLYMRTTSPFPFFLPLSLRWIRPLLRFIRSWPHFQHAPWLRAVPYLGYILVSTKWSLCEILQTSLLVGLS